MARVRLGGEALNADPIRQNADGTWTMIARDHTARTSPGTEFTVTAREVIEMAAAEQPSSGHAELNAAMAKERETLPPVAELLKAGPEHKPDAPDKGVSVPVPPPVAPTTAP